jgi:hypothetical protein
MAISSDRFAPQAPGTAVRFTASGTGGKGPYEYRWWVHDGTSWQMVPGSAVNTGTHVVSAFVSSGGLYAIFAVQE